MHDVPVLSSPQATTGMTKKGKSGIKRERFGFLPLVVDKGCLALLHSN